MEENKNLQEEQDSKFDLERESALEDAKRVKVLSPGALVRKRFLRNKLAITGLVILLVMFLFSFVGLLFSPYEIATVFKKTDSIKKEYATALYNTELRYYVADDADFPSMAKPSLMLAINDPDTNTFTVSDDAFQYDEPAPGVYRIFSLNKLAYVSTRGGSVTVEEGADVDSGLSAAFVAAQNSGEDSFTYEGKSYYLQKTVKDVYLCEPSPIAMASKEICDYIDPAYQDFTHDYNFRVICDTAVSNGETSFDYDGTTFELDLQDVEDTTSSSLKGSSYKAGSILVDGQEVMTMSRIIISAYASDIQLTPQFTADTRAEINKGESKFNYMSTSHDGEETKFFAETVNANIYIKAFRESEIIATYEGPSSEHLLGTDGNGMDLITRLMFGGRISLCVGFVVIIIELIIGIALGGVSGFFGGWVDMVCMRFVDLFNSIPYWPMLIIAGSVMDSLEIDSLTRLFFLMLILGFLSWPGIARIVRGQILMLREQEFMIACEANGIRTTRRIFKHLVPNVMPILIVQATMGLGSIIIIEATLSFLGLGVKYPMASWGSIINAATDLYVMTNYWWIWVPAGLCILATVLGFNFVGDGLRDAFDPKMKR